MIEVKNRRAVLQAGSRADACKRADAPHARLARSRPRARSREGRVTRLPTRGDVDPRISDIREQLIIEIATR